MHPALSVIVFTVASGAGYGLLAVIAGAALVGAPFAAPWHGIAAVGVALGLAGAGLLTSTLHLGRPARAWRGITQWRSSWLSREAVAALAAFGPALALAWGWFDGRAGEGAWRVVALTCVIGALATIGCTAMIYASLKPIRQWRGWPVIAGYLALGLASGALLAVLIARAFGAPAEALSVAALVLLALGAALKAFHWRSIDRGRSTSTPVTATGLASFSEVRSLDPPHTGSNYLLKEMGFRIARKHAAKLRRLAFALAFAAPVALTLGGLAAGAAGAMVLALVAVASNIVGTLVERWLFFAEATHTVTLYYGARTV